VLGAAGGWLPNPPAAERKSVHAAELGNTGSVEIVPGLEVKPLQHAIDIVGRYDSAVRLCCRICLYPGDEVSNAFESLFNRDRGRGNASRDHFQDFSRKGWGTPCSRPRRA
jgi:hypothetical protein